ncbi:MAG: M48 family metalloprotease [Candidatus Eremiobacteraeota bacterium]|nr:M48 family metalloprotease [Candidatus Eremiobacteraeota bacterium]MBC5827455.1 M48 family metalloprotease [Candidatus Eremiobacteraeota bacterium]
MQRPLAAAAIALLVGTVLPALPADAMNTAQEVALGEKLNAQIDRESVLIQDPFLASWVKTIGDRLTPQRYRKDINYRFEIIDSNEINSFALPGGFVHVDMGLLNFVSSDDELASVMGHEMGHVERRHVVTLAQKANILSVLIGVLSVLSPIGNVLGGYGGDLAYNKFSRQDELQADQYGLLLMTRAGYDPESMVDTMARLGDLQGTTDSRTDKYFLDHPDPKDRVAHLLGYPELSRTNGDQLTSQGIHDQEEGRYAYARAKFAVALAAANHNPLAAQRLAQVEVALRESGARAAADSRVANAFASDAPDRDSASSALAAAANVSQTDAAEAKERSKSARQEIETFFSQLSALSSGVPNLGQPKKKGNNLSLAVEGLNRLARDINGTLDMSSDVASTSTGLIADNGATLKAMAEPLRDGRLTPKNRALLAYYPTTVTRLGLASDGLVRSLDHARAAISMGADSVHLLSDFLNILNSIDTMSGDISPAQMPKVRDVLGKAAAGWDAAAAMALKASNEMYAGQTENLSAQITLLDLLSAPQRYDAYRRALAYRFPGVQTPDYATTLRLGITPGEIGCSAWLAYETKQRESDVIAASRADGSSCTDLALRRGLYGESMEIAEGLLYQDYIDKPHKT